MPSTATHPDSRRHRRRVDVENATRDAINKSNGTHEVVVLGASPPFYAWCTSPCDAVGPQRNTVTEARTDAANHGLVDDDPLFRSQTPSRLPAVAVKHARGRRR